MHYRLLRVEDSDEYVQIYREDDSELLGSVIKSRRLGLTTRYLVRLDNRSFSINQGLFFRRHWKVESTDTTIRFKWKLLGSGVTVRSSEADFSADTVSRGKLSLTSEEGRTALVIDRNALKSDDMLLVEDYDRLSFDDFISCSLLTSDRYYLW